MERLVVVNLALAVACIVGVGLGGCIGVAIDDRHEPDSPDASLCVGEPPTDCEAVAPDPNADPPCPAGCYRSFGSDSGCRVIPCWPLAQETCVQTNGCTWTGR